ncbi:WYL domain-containing protein [soil metagenome]
MPKKDTRSTLLRQWEMLRMLAVSRSDSRDTGRWDKSSEIARKLQVAGYDVSVRTVQRDLKELSAIFPIDLNDKNATEYGWRWEKGAHLDIPGMSASEALAMRLVEMHLKQLLPAAMLDGLQGVFAMAQSKLELLESQFSGQSKDWLNKVRVVPPTQPLLPPVVNVDAQAALYQGLLENKQLSVNYESIGNDTTTDLVLHPLGLVMRGALTYLVASAWKYPDVRLYALHRFRRVEMLDTGVKKPKGFDLDAAITNGFADFSNQDEPIQLELLCADHVAALLAETPLSKDQTTSVEADGRVRIKATVNDTWQLEWWLLGQGAGVEVCGPVRLREQIDKGLERTLGQYRRQGLLKKALMRANE